MSKKSTERRLNLTEEDKNTQLYICTYLSQSHATSGCSPQAVGQVMGDGGGHAQTNTLTGTILPPPGWADLTWEPGNGSLRGAELQLC